ncbi:hypothetical protein FRC12_003914 [Ceratobasidium sp. 428]|nr:hypothetical protein FRC12_003914 [Ceratobasidium sp. 428]
MSKPTCAYCGWVGKTHPAVERHIVQRRTTCLAARRNERNAGPSQPHPQQVTEEPRAQRDDPNVAGPSQPRPQRLADGPRAQRDDSNVAGPSRSRSPSVTLEEVEDDDMPGKKKNPPRRNPNAILEDDDTYEPPPPPRRSRSPSVTIEEVDDEDMAGNFRDPPRRNPNAIMEEVEFEIPPWGPHPFARRTRAGLFPEFHPDPTAGAALRFYEVDRETPPKYTSVLAEPDVFREAHWLDNIPISRRDEAIYFSLPRVRDLVSSIVEYLTNKLKARDWHWKNLKEFEQEVNRLPRGPSWYRETIVVTGDGTTEVLDLWKRDIIELVRYLLTDPRFIPHMRFAPERHYDTEERMNRVYGEMWSAKWWWRMQNMLGDYATIVPIIISTDKTKLTVFSGNQKAWPVYLTIGNISKDIRRCPSERATLLLGYLPVSNLGHISNERERSEARWQLFHAGLESILEPLKTFSRTGFTVMCADGGVRRVFPILAAYIADFPEQALITCVRESCCPVCWIPHNEGGDMSVRYPLRDRCRTLDALDDHWNGYSRTIKTLGIRPTHPFWADLPYVDISTCMAPDLLHQLDRGVFGDHMIKWTTILLTANEMDRRVKGMPRFQKLRHFAQGTSVISQWTGKEAKALGRTFLTIVAGHEDPKLVKAARSMSDFMARAHKHEVTDSDLAAMKEDILDFNRAKSVFVDDTVKDLLPSEDRFNDIPKIHGLTHYPYLISELGAPEGFSTEITERLHIDFVKKPWSTTNHVNATQQMIAYLQTQEAWSLLRAYMHDEGLVRDDRVRDVRVDDDDGEDDGPEDLVAGGRGADEAWEPAPEIAIAKRPSLGLSVRGADLIRKHHTTDLIPATIDYLQSVAPARTAFPISHNTVFKVWRRCKLRHNRLPFDPALGPQLDQVRAFNTSSDSEGRALRVGFFDVVLYSPRTVDARKQGLQRFEAGRVRAIFALPNHLHSLSSEPLAYIERFTPFADRPSTLTSLYTTQHASEAHRRSAIVVPLSQLRMTCHLAPRYLLLNSNVPVSSSTDLLSVHHSFLLNKFASAWLFSVFDYWENQRRLNNAWYIVSFLTTTVWLFSWILDRFSTIRNMHTLSPSPSPSPHFFFALNTTSRNTPQSLPTTFASPLDQFASGSSHHSATPRFAAPPLNSSRDGSNYLFYAPYDFPPASTRQLAIDNHRLAHGSAPGHDRSWVTMNAARVASPDLRRLPDPPSPPFSSSLVHRRHRGTFPRGAGLVEPSRSECNSNLIGHGPGVGLPGSEEDVTLGYKSLPVSNGACDLDARRRRIVESEQRRRNDLRGGFARLKDALPASHEKCSKVVLLDRATTYIGHLEAIIQERRDGIGVTETRRSAA